MAQTMTEKKTGSGVISKLKIAKGRRWDHLELLERIDATGSITAAASAMGMSYKAAWEAVEAINNLSEQPLVERKTGGSKGGERHSPFMAAAWPGRTGAWSRSANRC